MGWTAVCAGGRRPAREIAAREPSARSRRSRSPAKPSGTLHTGGAFHCCAHPIQAPPPTGTAARLRGPRGALNKGRCLVCWWVIGVVLKPGQVLPPPTGTAVGHQPGAVCPALVSNLARWGCSIRSWLAACRGSNDVVSPVLRQRGCGSWWCGAQSADHLGEKR